jgi:hypothetical protein
MPLSAHQWVEMPGRRLRELVAEVVPEVVVAAAERGRPLR